jgi:hypothetical protein
MRIKGETLQMIQQKRAQKDQLKAFKAKFKRLQKSLAAIHKKPDTKISRMEY